MKTLAEFIKTTLIGGVLIILPIYLAVLLLAKTVTGMLALLAPVTAQIPADVGFRQIVPILLLALPGTLSALLDIKNLKRQPAARPRNRRKRTLAPGRLRTCR